MNGSLSLDDLSRQINSWCAEHEITPANGQAGEVTTDRTVRYYRTLGLIDAPEGGEYGEKHLLQLIAVRLLQAQGLPLRRIRELLFGRSLQELREIRRRGLQEAQKAIQVFRTDPAGNDELWRTIQLDDDFLLISRRGKPLTSVQREAILAALRTVSSVQPQTQETEQI